MYSVKHVSTDVPWNLQAGLGWYSEHNLHSALLSMKDMHEHWWHLVQGSTTAYIII